MTNDYKQRALIAEKKLREIEEIICHYNFGCLDRTIRAIIQGVEDDTKLD